MERTNNDSAIIADTNGLISIIDHPGSCHRAKTGLRKGPKRVIIPEVVIKELQKIRGISVLQIINQVSSILRKKVSILKCNSDIRLAAKELESKYLLAHFPDSVLLAMAQFGDHSILTYDRGLISTAKKIGVKTFTPKMEKIK
jgi:rRNA-processing protein FCF1